MVDRYYRKIENVGIDIENSIQISSILLKLKEYDEKLSYLSKNNEKSINNNKKDIKNNQKDIINNKNDINNNKNNVDNNKINNNKNDITIIKTI